MVRKFTKKDKKTNIERSWSSYLAAWIGGLFKTRWTLYDQFDECKFQNSIVKFFKKKFQLNQNSEKCLNYTKLTWNEIEIRVRMAPMNISVRDPADTSDNSARTMPKETSIYVSGVKMMNPKMNILPEYSTEPEKPEESLKIR